jgi:hypothetical protein
MNSPDLKRLHFFLRLWFLVNLLFFGYLYLIILLVRGHTSLSPPVTDFVRYWAASALTLAGNPAGAYSLPLVKAVGQAVSGWAPPSVAPYPPTFLLMILPLALMPYQLSLAVWRGLTLGGYLLLMRRVAPHPLTPWLFLGFPAIFLNISYGQNGFLSTVLLGGGLMWAERHPLAGGGLLGMLTYKPQLAWLIPLALVAGRRWRALGGMLTVAASLILASLWAFGPDTWTAFSKSLSGVVLYADQQVLWRKMPTIYAAARLAGAGFAGAMTLQGCAAAAAGAAVIWVWARGAPLALRAAVLTLGLLLATPYAFEYDLALLSLPFAFLGWEEYRQGRLGGQAFLIFCWLAFYQAQLLAGKHIPANPLILVAMLAFVLYRAAALKVHPQAYLGEKGSLPIPDS